VLFGIDFGRRPRRAGAHVGAPSAPCLRPSLAARPRGLAALECRPPMILRSPRMESCWWKSGSVLHLFSTGKAHNALSGLPPRVVWTTLRRPWKCSVASDEVWSDETEIRKPADCDAPIPRNAAAAQYALFYRRTPWKGSKRQWAGLV